jgi:hypothetical protein
MSGYVSTDFASKAMGVTKSRITVLAQQGKINGAVQLDNGVWLIPREWAENVAKEKAKSEGMLSVTESAKQAGVTREAIYLALREGRLRGYKGKRGKLTAWAVDQESLKSYMAGRN